MSAGRGWIVIINGALCPSHDDDEITRRVSSALEWSHLIVAVDAREEAQALLDAREQFLAFVESRGDFCGALVADLRAGVARPDFDLWWWRAVQRPRRAPTAFLC
jgi:arginine/ornithine N-succinyltransferase beta subunit